MFKPRNHSDLRERAGVAAPSLPPSQEEGRSSGDPRCIARSVEALFLGEPAAARVSEGRIWKCTCAGGGLSAGASSRDRSNEAKGVASEAFAVERREAHTLDFFVACACPHEKTRSHVPVLRTGACGDASSVRAATAGGRPVFRCVSVRDFWRIHEAVTWLILPVVICLFQRLSHACLSINTFIL